MICVRRNFEGILQFELIPNGRAMNVELYCQQPARVYEKLEKKSPALVRRKRALFQQDNAKPHTAKKTKEKFDELEEIEILPLPTYNPVAAPSDYGLFRPMEHLLPGRRFESFDQVEKTCPGVLRFEAGRRVLQSNPDACRSVTKDCWKR